VEQSIKVFQKYYPASVSDIAAYSPGSLLRFSCVINRFHRFEDGWFLFAEHDNQTLAVFLPNEAFNQTQVLIKELFGPDFKKLSKIQDFLESANWRSWTITVYGQIIFIDEDTPNVYLEAHYFWPQIFQSELDKKHIKPAEKLVVNKVTEKQVKDFKQRIEALSKLFRGE
jgi:hypothetical protein